MSEDPKRSQPGSGKGQEHPECAAENVDDLDVTPDDADAVTGGFILPGGSDTRSPGREGWIEV